MAAKGSNGQGRDASTAAGPIHPPPKILMTKIGLDGHDRGVRLVATFLRDAGMEVVYTGPWQSIGDVVRIALEEDVDAIGISTLASDHLMVPRLVDALRDAGLGHVGIALGGTIPESDDEWLHEAGVRMISRPGDSSEKIVTGMEAVVRTARAQETQADAAPPEASSPDEPHPARSRP